MTGIENKLQAIIWDMDGVLVDNSELHYQTWVDIYRTYGNGEQPLRRDRFEAVFGMRNDETVSHLFAPARVTSEFIAEVSDAKEELYRQRLQGNVQALPGVRAWLAYWPAVGAKQALASSAPQPNIDAILTELQVEPFFDAIVSAEAGGISRGKPAPDIFLEAARRLGVAPANCLVIEDAMVGIQAAKSAGMRCIAVTTTHARNDLVEADRVVATLAGLPPDRVAARWPGI